MLGGGYNEIKVGAIWKKNMEMKKRIGNGYGFYL